MTGATTGSTWAQITWAALLDAAREVFAASGYDDAKLVDIAERAGASIGSLYHHFTAKSDLWITLYDEYTRRQQHRSARAFRAALAAGEDDVLQLFIAGTRAYLEGCWEEWQPARIFLSGSGPRGRGGAVEGQRAEDDRRGARAHGPPLPELVTGIG